MSEKTESRGHVPVLLNEVVEGLNPQPNKNFIDCTLGAGGHSQEILKLTGPAGKVVGLDMDQETQKQTAKRLQTEFGQRFIPVHGNFRQIAELVELRPIHGILYDLGLSSIQLSGDGGFSFKSDEKLDMRFDKNAELTAYEIINYWSKEKLEKIIKELGEERWARKIAENIINQKKVKRIEKASELAELIEKTIPRKLWPPKIHPATRTFQAIRMAVNDELGNLEKSLPEALKLLEPKGRMAVISFHSLEDRKVKNFFKDQLRGCICPPEIPKCVCDNQPKIKLINKKIIIASEEEIKNNPRSRSAKLRVIEKL
ncbi:16S rRNA (cytosine(1402)-N(4))-methyltransferase RsmH [Candidatus Uhrbacteria bacterium]|nr:16S rRNA (cytosine(1402)-N(4))-methyltransferase RsmH [Candidatus Uhrbacteria bacterium]